MSFNLLDLVKDQVTGALVEKAAGFIGESTGSTSSALTSIVPSLIGGLISKADEPSGAAGIMNLLNTGGLTDSLGSLSNLFGGDSSSLDLGGNLLTGLLGDKLGPLAGLISKASGIGEGSAGSLLKMAAPLLMGTLAKKVLGGGVSIAGLKDLLLGQKDSIKGALPAGYESALGFSPLSKVGETASAAAASAASTVESTGGGLKKILPLLLLAGLGILAFLFMKKCKGGEEVVTTTDTEIMDDHEGHDHGDHAHMDGEHHTEATHTEATHVEGDHATTEGGASHTTTTSTTVAFDGDAAAGDISFDQAATNWGVLFKDGSFAPSAGTTVENTTVDGVPVSVYTSADNVVTRVFKNDDGVETVIVQGKDGKLTFFQKIGNFFKSIPQALAFKKTKVKSGNLLKGLKGLLDADAKGGKGKIPGAN